MARKLWLPILIFAIGLFVVFGHKGKSGGSSANPVADGSANFDGITILAGSELKDLQFRASRHGAGHGSQDPLAV